MKRGSAVRAPASPVSSKQKQGNGPATGLVSGIFERVFPEGFGNVAQAFTHRNYRIYAAGNAVSLIGVWMQRVAVGWLAWSLTHSGTWLGIVSMAEFFPVVFLSPLAGALADRRDRVGIIRVSRSPAASRQACSPSSFLPARSGSSCCSG